MCLEVPHSLEDRPRPVPLIAAFPNRIGQFIGRHVLRDKGGLVESILGVQPPLVVPQQSVLFLQSGVKGRARIRHQNVVRREAKLVAHRKFVSLPNRGERVEVMPQRKCGPGLHVMIAKDFDLRLISIPTTGLRQVGCFFH